MITWIWDKLLECAERKRDEKRDRFQLERERIARQVSADRRLTSFFADMHDCETTIIKRGEHITFQWIAEDGGKRAYRFKAKEETSIRERVFWIVVGAVVAVIILA